MSSQEAEKHIAFLQYTHTHARTHVTALFTKRSLESLKRGKRVLSASPKWPPLLPTSHCNCHTLPLPPCTLLSTCIALSTPFFAPLLPSLALTRPPCTLQLALFQKYRNKYGHAGVSANMKLMRCVGRNGMRIPGFQDSKA